MTAMDLSGFATPGRGRGLLDVFTRGYLLRLLVRKGVSTRYRNSALGWTWSYVKPLAQYTVYYFVMGVVLGFSRGIENFAVYLLSGVIVINLFNEAFSNATKSIVDNKALVKKIYLPRELFPVAAVIVALIHFLPQAAVLLAVSILTGWRPSLLELLYVVLGALLITMVATGLGLFFGAINVSFRDAQNFVEIILVFATWTAPVLYSWDLVDQRLPDWAVQLYLLNPLTSAVELFHAGFWFSTTDGGLQPPPNLAINVAIGFGIALFLLILGQLVFRRFERSFAQDL